MDLRQSIGNQTDFSLRITNHVALKSSSSTNLALSPLSIHVALSLIAAGSKGQTLRQLASFLKSDRAEELNSLASQVIALVLADASSSGGPKVSFTSGMWVDKSLRLKDSFSTVLKEVYQAEAEYVDFMTQADEAVEEVNSWVDKRTNGLITGLVPPGSVDHNTRSIFGNALYFKGAWTEKFDASQTKDSVFHLLDGNSVQVPFMTSDKRQFVSWYDGFKALRLPYKRGEDGKQYSMYLYLPDAADGLWSLWEKLSSAGSSFLGDHLPVQKEQVGRFMIPRFKLCYGCEISGVLKDLGLTLPFDGKELTEMVDSCSGQSLYVSSIFHKAFIEVNEEGTEAAAATAAVFGLRSIPKPPIDFVADHPFAFLIREDMTGVVMFTGHVLNPLLTR